MLTSRQPIWIGWGEELTYLYNDAYKAIIGGKHPEALGRPASEVWAEIWPDIGPLLAKAMGGVEGTYVEQQLLIMERNGYPEETYYTFSYSPIPDDDGGPGGIICANTDDTRRVVGQRQIALLRELAANANAARTRVAVCQTGVQAFEADRRDLPFAAIYLLEPDGLTLSLAGRHGIEVGHRATPLKVNLAEWPAAMEVLAGDQPVLIRDFGDRYGPLPSGDWRIAPRDAALLQISTTGAKGVGVLLAGLNPFRVFDDDYQGFLGLISGQISAAIANADAYEDERRQVEALAELDRAKTAFFANVSHEFRTPLTLMLGPLEEALANPEATPALRAQIDLAHRNSVRLLKLVNTLLDFSRMESGRAEAQFRPVDLGQMVIDLASTFRSATERAGLGLELWADPDLESVHVDAGMIEKIVLNLLSNAFKFTLAGRISVSVGRGTIPNTVEIVVADTGVGVPAEEIPRLFERFHRVQGQRGRSFEGSGIGLALVQELVQVHGGSIEVESQEDKGSVFRVILPIGSSHLPPQQLESTIDPAPAGAVANAYVEEALRWLPGEHAEAPPEAGWTQGDTRRERVLLADDNLDMREYVARLLSSAGLEVVTASDGAAALAQMRLSRPDLVLTDIMMPVMDGLGLLRAIRNDAALSDLPVIMLSARAGEDAAIDGLDAGADDYLSKPFSARELLARVGANLTLSRARREATTLLASRNAQLQDAQSRLQALNTTLEQRVAEAIAERKTLADIVEGTDAFVQVADLDYRWLAFNRAAAEEFERLFGVRPKVGQSMLDVLDGRPEHRGDVQAIWRRALAGEEFTEVAEFGDPGPGRRHYEVKFNVLRDPSGRQIGAFQFVHDVTSRVREQERLAQAEEQLRQAQKMEAMGQLTGGVAHDFNNLLTPIVGALDMLQRRGVGGEREHRLIDGALQAADRARVLVQRLLAFARRQPLQAVAVDIGALVRGMAELVGSIAGPQIKVSVNVAADLALARADPNQLEMALLNLCVNARDAMPSGGLIRISVSNDVIKAGERRDLAAGDYVRLSVADTGTGMDPATLSRSVEPFFSTKGLGKGTGLGLSMAHGLAQQLGGTLTLRSGLGLGTNVELWLPKSDASPPMALQPGASAPTTGSRGLALLVDDEDIVRASIADMLAELGYDVAACASAEEALERIEAGIQASLIVTDHLMPGMTGVDLARAAKQFAAATPVLIISGYADLDGIDPDLPRLTKPFLSSELAAALSALH